MKSAAIHSIQLAVAIAIGTYLSAVAELQATESGGRLLERTSILLGRNLPVLLGGGGYDHGKYVSHDSFNNLPLCTVFLGMLRNAGIEAERFGINSGTQPISNSQSLARQSSIQS